MADLIPIAKKRTLRRSNFELKEFFPFLESLKTESDRGMVLISAAFLDDLLERSVRSILIDHARVDHLLDSSGALGSLGARSVAAFALGILSELEYQESERIRKVRNSFAHDVSCTFGDEKVKGICLTFVNVLTPGSLKGRKPRDQFLGAALSLLASVSGRLNGLTKRRLKYVEPK